MLIFEVKNEEGLRNEIVKYLRHLAKVEVGSLKTTDEGNLARIARNRAAVLKSVAGEIASATITKETSHDEER